MAPGLARCCPLAAFSLTACLAEFPPPIDETEPEPNVPSACVARVAVGGHHTCVLTGNGDVACFGANESGQLGDKSLDPSPEPRAVELETAAVDVAAGEAHTCAVLEDDRVFCWGSNELQQLKEYTLPNQLRPYWVEGVLGQRIWVGSVHACVLNDGTLSCFGNNEDWQLGTDEPSGGPVEVALSPPVVEAAAGGAHSCALLEDQTVWCWGFNSFGETGQPPSSKTPPLQVELPAGAAHVYAGPKNSCAVLVDGTLYCWGDSDDDKLAADFGNTDHSTPEQIGQLGTDALDVAIGDRELAARLGVGPPKAWGANASGLFADGSVQGSREPVPMGLDSPKSIVFGPTHACAINATDSLLCWGSQKFDQLGIPASDDVVTEPIEVLSCAE